MHGSHLRRDVLLALVACLLTFSCRSRSDCRAAKHACAEGFACVETTVGFECVRSSSPAVAGAADGPGSVMDDVAALLGDGKRHIQAGDTASARRLLTRCLFLEPDNASCMWELGWAAWKEGSWLDCIGRWRKVRELSPDFSGLDKWQPKAYKKAEEKYLPGLIWDAIAANGRVYAIGPVESSKRYVFFGRRLRSTSAVSRTTIRTTAGLAKSVVEHFGVEPGKTIHVFDSASGVDHGRVLGFPEGSPLHSRVRRLVWTMKWEGGPPMQRGLGTVVALDPTTGRVDATLSVADFRFYAPHVNSVGADHNWDHHEPDESFPVGILLEGDVLVPATRSGMRFESTVCFGHRCRSVLH